jgi:hypothetical protein
MITEEQAKTMVLFLEESCFSLTVTIVAVSSKANAINQLAHILAILQDVVDKRENIGSVFQWL